MPKKTVDVKASLKDQFTIDVEARNFKMVIDQPEAMKGKNEGPTPLEYFFFSLAGCICTIGRIMAMQRKIDLKGMEVRIEGDLDTDVLLGKDQSQRPGFQDIRVYTKIDAPMTREEKEAFLKEIDSRCPISDNIEHVSTIKLVVEE
ncbi:MAG: OsmC family protein [Clostridia bacterium]|nr:OsmC family protein [Clostridia bacterium]